MALKFGTSGIRGLNEDFTELIVKAYIQAFIEHFEQIKPSESIKQITPIKQIDAPSSLDPVGKMTQDRQTPKRVAVAGDLRESTPGIIFLIKRALEEFGYQWVDCGRIPTPALALYCSEVGVPGVMVTGSHIPADRNGIKFYWPWGEILKADEQAIVKNFDRIMAQKIQEGSSIDANQEAGADAARALYIDRYVRFFSSYRSRFSGKKIIVYQHSTVSRDLWKPILSGLGFIVVEVGRSSIFTPVDTETDEAVRAIRTVFDVSAESNFFAVVSSDGDGDRPLLCDETLQMVRGDSIGILSAEFLGAETVVTPVSSNSALERIGGFKKIIRTQIGSPFVIEAMAASAEKSLTVGYEANGGLLLGSSVHRDGVTLRPLPTRDAILPILCSLALAVERNQTVSELVGQLPARYTDSDLLRAYPVEKKQVVYDAIRKGSSFQQQFINKYGLVMDANETDGLRLTFANDDIIHFRPSGNAPEFRCYAEAGTAAQAKQLVREGIHWLEDLRSTL
jgi:phosphomannomutase